MTLLRRLSLIALMIASLPGGGASSAQAPSTVYSRFKIGVVRGDGIFLPLASKENETWTVLRTYSSVGDRSLYKLLDAQSVPREGWTYVPWDSALSRPLALRDMVTTDAHCGRQEGFATDAPSPGSKLDSPHLMSGIAFHGDVSALRIEDHASPTRRDEQSSRVAKFVAQLTHAVEAETASPQAIPPEERERVPVQITTLARDRVDRFGDVIDYYYFESHKRYRPVESYANGWLVSSRGSFSVLRTTAGIYRRGRTHARQFGRVLGVLRLPIRRSSVWVMEMRGYEGDTYEIVEPGSEHVLKVAGGGC